MILLRATDNNNTDSVVSLSLSHMLHMCTVIEGGCNNTAAVPDKKKNPPPPV